jgi:hypothetical protein
VIGQNKKFVAKKKKLFVAKHLSEKMEKIKMGQEIEIKVTWCRALTIILNMSAHITTIILYIEFKKNIYQYKLKQPYTLYLKKKRRRIFL